MKWECWWNGKIKSDYIRHGVHDYRIRIQNIFPLKFREFPESKNKTPSQSKKYQAQVIVKALKENDRLILLDEHGKQFRSVEFAGYIEEQILYNPFRLIFFLGGPFGYTKDLLARAESKISLSKMTYSHELARLVFLEQFYRALTISKRIPYHNE
jgi:23S rRNA (pseudouridine1915-N3)-methyltransferase